MTQMQIHRWRVQLHAIGYIEAGTAEQAIDLIKGMLRPEAYGLTAEIRVTEDSISARKAESLPNGWDLPIRSSNDIREISAVDGVRVWFGD